MERFALSAPLFSLPSRRRSRNSRHASSTDAEIERQRGSASYSRYSSDQQDAKSIPQQQGPCRERSKQDGLELRPELEFSDEAVSGTKLRRDGLDRMMAAAAQGLFGTLYFFDLSRLARESIITSTMLKTLVQIHKVRVVSVTEGIDSDNEGWYTLATILNLQHEQYLKTLSANVLRGLIWNALDGLSVGDYCLGYGSAPVEGSESSRRGRHARPKMRYVILEENAEWVRKVFRWFVKERRSIQWIVRELNRLNAPTDHRNRFKKWGRNGVIALLRRTKYIGVWPWGELKNCRNPLTGQITQEFRPEDECKSWLRHFPDLQIIDLETFEAAQTLLDENVEKCAEHRAEKGQLHGSEKNSARPRHLLQGLIKCSGCGSAFYVGGANGKYLICPSFRQGLCTVKTMLPRALAEKLILEKVSSQILLNPAWRRAVHDCALRTWKEFESTLPTELAAAERQLSDVEQWMSRLLDKIEKGLDDPEVHRRLEERGSEKRAIAKQVEKLRKASAVQRPEPTAGYIDEQIRNLYETLNGSAPAAAVALKELIGDIVVQEVSRTGRKRPRLRGELHIPASRAVRAIGLGTPADAIDVGSEAIVIDFADPDPKVAASEEVKTLADAGLANWEISEKLDLHPSRVTLLWKFWFESRNLPVPPRSARGKRKPRATPRYQEIAPESVALWNSGLSESEVGRRFRVTQATVRKAIEWWHAERGMPIPKFKDRRAARMEQAATMLGGGKSVGEIAKALKCCATTASKLLDDWYASKGKQRPDGRTERHRRAKEQSRKSA